MRLKGMIHVCPRFKCGTPNMCIVCICIYVHVHTIHMYAQYGVVCTFAGRLQAVAVHTKYIPNTYHTEYMSYQSSLISSRKHGWHGDKATYRDTCTIRICTESDNRPGPTLHFSTLESLISMTRIQVDQEILCCFQSGNHLKMWRIARSSKLELYGDGRRMGNK